MYVFLFTVTNKVFISIVVVSISQGADISFPVSGCCHLPGELAAEVQRQGVLLQRFALPHVHRLPQRPSRHSGKNVIKHFFGLIDALAR
jgi:hypothetical protein